MLISRELKRWPVRRMGSRDDKRIERDNGRESEVGLSKWRAVSYANVMEMV